MRKFTLLALLLTGCATSYRGNPVLVDSTHGSLYRGSQPTSQAFVDSIGLKPPCVLYRLSKDGEGGISFADESLWAHTSGCAFIPVNMVSYPFPSETGLRQAADQIQSSLNKGVSVYVHCMRGKDRTGGVIATWQLLYTNLPLSTVLDQRKSYLSSLDEIIDVEETLILEHIAKEVGK